MAAIRFRSSLCRFACVLLCEERRRSRRRQVVIHSGFASASLRISHAHYGSNYQCGFDFDTCTANCDPEMQKWATRVVSCAFLKLHANTLYLRLDILLILCLNQNWKNLKSHEEYTHLYNPLCFFCCRPCLIAFQIRKRAHLPCPSYL